MQEYNTLIEESAASLTEALWSEFRDQMVDAGEELDGLLRHLVVAIGRRTLEQLLRRWAEFFVETSDDRVAARKDTTFLTILGPVSVVLARLRTRGSRAQHSPMHETFGVRSTGRSARVERALVDFGAEQSFDKAAGRHREHYGDDVGRTSLLRVVERHGERAEGFVEQKLREAADERVEHGSADLVFIQVDGSMVPTGEFKSAGDAGRTDLPPDAVVRPREWREVRVGLAFEAGAVDPTYLARIDGYEAVVEQLYGAAAVQGMGNDTQVVSTTDGGNGIKQAIGQRFPECAFVLDHPHLVQHLWLVAREQHSDAAQAWVDETLDRLWRGEAKRVLDELRETLLRIRTAQPRAIDPAPGLRKFVDYLDEHRESVSYQAFEDAGWVIGSGRCESAHRQIPQARLKIPGATWKVDSANRMLALRVIRANGWWDEFWGQKYGPCMAA